MTLDERIARLRQQRKARESVAGIGNGTPAEIRREPSTTERATVYRKNGYFAFLCFHGRSKFTPCVSCKRTQRDADENWHRVLLGKSVTI